MYSIRAITVDLDDTLWPIQPVIQHAEQRVYDWIATHCPRVAARYDLTAIRTVREDVARRNSHLHHDLTALRKLALAQILTASGYSDDFVEGAFEEFMDARNQVIPFPDVIPALNALGRHFPIASISNGNADLTRIGLGSFFSVSVSARMVGYAKPHPNTFLTACRKLGQPPARVLHIGDDPEEDVLGAAKVGMKAVWMNRNRDQWTLDHQPDGEVSSLLEILSLIEVPTATDPTGRG